MTSVRVPIGVVGESWRFVVQFVGCDAGWGVACRGRSVSVWMGGNRWNGDEYKNQLENMAKMKMNWFGLHTYPWRVCAPAPSSCALPQAQLRWVQ